MKFPIQFCLGGRNKWVGCVVLLQTLKMLSRGDTNNSHLPSAGLSPALRQALHLAFQSFIEVTRLVGGYSAGQAWRPSHPDRNWTRSQGTLTMAQVLC